MAPSDPAQQQPQDAAEDAHNKALDVRLGPRVVAPLVLQGATAPMLANQASGNAASSLSGNTASACTRRTVESRTDAEQGYAAIR